MDWVSVHDRLPTRTGTRVRVKSESGKETKAFFMADRAAWVGDYGIKCSYWLETPSAELLQNITHWQFLN